MAHTSGPGGAAEGTGTYNELWIERVARALRFDRVGAVLLGRPGAAPYLLFLAIYIVDVPILSTVQYLGWGYHPYLVNPSVIAAPVLLLYAIWASRRMRNAHDDAIDDVLPDDPADERGGDLSRLDRALLWVGTGSTRPRDPATLRSLAAPRVKLIGLLVAWALYASWILFNPDVLPLIIEHEGPVIGRIKFFLLVPLAYLPIATEFVVTYLAIILFLPVKIRATGFIDFEDPLGFGGLRPVGDLTRLATTHYLLGVAGYVAGIGLGQVVGRAEYVADVGPVAPAVLGTAIVLGVTLFFFPIVALHGHMKHAKHAKISQIADQVQTHGPDGDESMFPETTLPESVEEGNEYVHLFIKMRKVENTREYPVDVSHIQELILAAIVPYVAHVTVTFLLSATGGGH